MAIAETIYYQLKKPDGTELISTDAFNYNADILDAAIKAISDIANAAISQLQKGVANGVAELDADGKVPSTQLPSYVDDVLEYNNYSSFPVTGETGKIYVTKDTNITYRWSGSGYVEISKSLALGETSATAYRGDRGKIAYDHSQATGNPHGATPADIGAVPTSRTVNGKALSANISLTAGDVGAANSSHTHGAADLPATMPPSSHNHSADNITSGTLPTARGGTGQTSFAEGTQYCGIDPNNSGKIKPERASAPIISRTSSFTLVLTDAGGVIQCNSSSAITATIPTNASVAFPIGTEIEICRWGTGGVTIAGAGGVDIRCKVATRIIADQYQSVCLKKISTNIWELQGV